MATRRDPQRVNEWDLLAFTDALSCSASTLRRLTRAISLRALPQTPRETACAPAWDVDRPLLSVGESLRRCPSAGWPEAYRGRRDAWLLVLLSPTDTGGRGLSRSQAVNLQPADVSLDFATHDDPARCPKCVAVRWLHVVGLEHRWSRSTVRSHLATVNVFPQHVCDQQPDEQWRSAWTLAPAIDRHGWPTDWRPMTPRAVTEVLRRRRDSAAPLVSLPPTPAQKDPAPERVRDHTATALDLDVVARSADAVNARVKALLDDTENLLRPSRRRT
jgi:hypothetical protein